MNSGDAAKPADTGGLGNTPEFRPGQQVLSAKLPCELVDALTQRAREEGISRNMLIRRALENKIAGTLPEVVERERFMARAAARIAEETALAQRLKAQGLLRTGFPR
jgi:predicted transcriptional regulator